MPESVPPKDVPADPKSVQSRQGEAASPTSQRGDVGGPPRAGGDHGAATATTVPGGGEGGPPRAGAAAPGAPVGAKFVKVRWLNKIGGHEKDGEWTEERRARNLVASGHVEIIEEEKK